MDAVAQMFWPGLLLRLDGDGRIVKAAVDWERLVGPVDELVGKTLLELAHVDDRAALAAALAEPRAACSVRVLDREGAWRHMRVELAAAPDGGIACVAHDVTTHVRAEETLRTTEQRLRYLLAHAPVVLFAVDADGRVTLFEGGVEELRPAQGALVGQPVARLWPSDHPVRKAVERALGGEEVNDVVAVPERGLALETRYTPLRDALGQVTGALGVAVDISDERRAQEQLVRTQAKLVQADRMATVGVLAAGVAHEINNPLTYVRLHLGRLISLERAQALSPERSHRLEMLGECLDGVHRVEKIVGELQRMARAGEPGVTPVDVCGVLESAILVAAHTLRHRAEVVRHFEPVPPVLADEGRLGQVFLNLLINAAQAIPEGAGHLNQITVTTRVIDGRVVIEVADTGTGIPPEQLARIFDPFFTTKPPDVGTGLGLPIARDIVQHLGGEISVESTLGRGSTFRVALPATERPVIGPPPPEPPLSGLPPPSGRVLVIDDDAAVAGALASALSPHHEVRLALGGSQAFAVLQEDPDFDVILCDAMMPDVSGIDVYEAVALVNPQLASRFVLMSGGAWDPRARMLIERLEGASLKKPCSADEVLAVVDERLRHRPRRGAPITPSGEARLAPATPHAPPPRPGRH
jgi:PAS domain S-box-containing protein